MQDKIWVKVVKAKYFPTKNLWSADIRRNTSSMWKAILDIKPVILSSIQWKIGDGTKISVINEPRFLGWQGYSGITMENLPIRVADLFSHESQQWRYEVIRDLLGEGALREILINVQKPKRQPLVEDKLIWTHGKKGTYTTKEGYESMIKLNQVQPNYNQHQKRAWVKIWKWKGLIPRVRTFLWRAVQGGLLTMVELHKRIRTIDPRCQRCGQENEYTMHLLFFCNISRATWYASRVPLRIEHLPLDFTETLMQITDNLDRDQIQYVCNLMWCLWKARNEEIFSAKKTNPQTILVRTMSMEGAAPQATRVQEVRQQQPVHVPAGRWVIILDASWDGTSRGGLGIQIFNPQGRLHQALCKGLTVSDPFHAEATALLEALMYITGDVQRNCYAVYSDCKVLIDVVARNQIEETPSWRAEETVARCIQLYLQDRERVYIQHVTRRALHTPHQMANWVRRSADTYLGLVSAAEIPNLDLEEQLDPFFFALNSSSSI